MRSDLPGQFELAGTSEDLAGLARKRAEEPLKAKRPQEACDIGLFGDDSKQLDIVTLASRPARSSE